MKTYIKNLNWLEIWDYAKDFFLMTSIASGLIMVVYGYENSNELLVICGSFFLGSSLHKIYAPMKEYLKNRIA